MNFDELDPNWRAEDKIKTLVTANKLEKGEIERKNIDVRAEYTNLTRRLHQSRIDDDYFDTNNTSDIYQKEFPQRVRADLEKAKEIERERNEIYNSLKMRQYNRINIPELRELESKLRTAYVTKELKTQLAEKEAKKISEKIYKMKADEKIRQSLESAQKSEQRERDEEKKRQIEYKKALQDQMILNYQLKQNKYEEFLQDKKYLDEVIQRIYDEDQREKEMKMCKMKKTKQEIIAFKQAQDMWKTNERRRLEEENEKMQSWIQQKLDEEDARMREKMLKDAQEADFKEKVAMELYEIQKEKKDRTALILELQEEESKQKAIDKAIEDMKREIQKKIETQQILAIQTEERRERIRQEELDDKLYRQQMMAKMENDDKLEQMSAEKRRRKMIELRREIEDSIRERRAKRAEELKELLYIEENYKQMEKDRLKIIEDERIRLLKEHAHNLIGYFPPGVLRPEDEEFLGQDVVRPKSIDCPK